MSWTGIPSSARKSQDISSRLGLTTTKLWDLLPMVNILNFDINDKTIRSGLTNVLRGAHELFRDQNNETLADNAGSVEIAQTIRNAIILTNEIKGSPSGFFYMAGGGRSSRTAVSNSLLYSSPLYLF